METCIVHVFLCRLLKEQKLSSTSLDSCVEVLASSWTSNPATQNGPITHER